MKDKFVEKMNDFLSEMFPTHQDPDLGTFFWDNNLWKISLQLQFPFQDDVKAIFQCRGKKKEFPDVLKQNISDAGSNLSLWWNSFASKMNKTIERRKIEGLEKFEIKDLFITFSKAPISRGAKWGMELTTNPYCVFDGRFKGFDCLRAKHLEIY